MNTESPILLVQWLTDPKDGQEAATAFADFSSRLDLAYTDVGAIGGGKETIHETLISWATDNPFCQTVYIGCHGFEDRIGPTGTLPSDEIGVTFQELWKWLQEAHILHRRALLKDAIKRRELFKGQKLKADEGRFDLWFGACRSAAAVNCWSPLSALTRPRPIQAVVGFEDKPNPSAVAIFLNTLMDQQRLDILSWSDETWESLIKALPNNRPVVFNLDYEAKPAKWVRPYGF